MIKLKTILNEIQIAGMINTPEKLCDFLNKNKHEFISLALKELGKENDNEWNYVRQGWKRNKFILDEYDDKQIVLDDGEDDCIFATFDPKKQLHNGDFEIDTHKSIFKGIPIYWGYY